MDKVKLTESFKKIFKMENILIFLFIVSTIFLIVIAIYPNNDFSYINSERTEPYNDGWYISSENKTVTLPYIKETEENESITISKKIDYDKSTATPMVLSFMSSQQSIVISVDNEVKYEYCTKPNSYLEVYPPPARHIFRVSPDMFGKVLEITYSSPVKNFSGVINGIEVGSKAAHGLGLMSKNIVSLLLCFSVFMIGIFSIALYILIKSKIPNFKSILYLGIFAILISFWSACETKSLQLFTGNVQFIMFLSYISILLIPIPIIMFFRERFSGILRKIYDIMLYFYVACFVARFTLQVFNILVISNCFPYYIGTLIVLMIFISVSTTYLYIKNKNRQNFIHLISILFLFSCGGIDFIRFFTENILYTNVGDPALFFRVGMIIFVFGLIYATIDQMVVYYLEGNKAIVYKNLAYIDSLSNLYNRTYLSEVCPKVFDDVIRHKTTIAIILLDIDNFKKYNDNYGHLQGDHAISMVAKAIKTSVNRPLDFIVRYGGEEFLAILPDIDVGGAKYIAEKISRAIHLLQIEHKYSEVGEVITVSQGIYCAAPNPETSLEHVIDMADKALYLAKNSGKNRYMIIEDENSRDN